MRSVYQPEPEDFWLDYYMSGGAMTAFSGVPYQRGYGIGSIFKSLFRFILPFAKKIVPGLASEALGATGDILRNVKEGKDWKGQAKQRLKKSAGYTLEQFGKHMQTGSGVGKRPKKSIKRGRRGNMEGILRSCPSR